jgi:hypothetical protein
MTSDRDLEQQEPAVRPDNPGDIPAIRPASLDRLEALVGQWKMEAPFDARTTFEWLEGKFFLLQRFVTDHPAAPSGIAIIAANEGRETFSQHYYDSRGVARVYQMSLDGGVWRVWREEPGFWQQYTGVISDDGTRITGSWEGSVDGREWSHDFDLNYIKVA